MKILTISRQFGSGGRELGEKLSQILGWDYYDKNIIDILCKNENMDPDYVRRMMTDKDWTRMRTNVHGSFSQIGINSNWQISLLSDQRKIIENIAKNSRDCIIVGRDADIILSEYHPLRILIVADMPYRLNRCLKREERNEGKKLTERQLLQNIKKMDKNRLHTREILTGKSKYDPSTFDMIINSASWDSDKLASYIAEIAKEWKES